MGVDTFNIVKNQANNLKNQTVTFMQQNFDCFIDPSCDEEIILEKKFNRNSQLNEFTKELKANNKKLIPKQLVTSENEKNEYSKSNIIKNIDSMEKLEYTKKFQQDNISYYECGNSDYSDKDPVIKIIIEYNKNELEKCPTVEEIGDAIINPSKRIKWDKNISLYKIDTKFSDESCVVHIETSKNLTKMLEFLTFYDKRIAFMEKNIFYEKTSSCPLSCYPLNDNESESNRATNYFGSIKIYEDKNKFYLIFVNQININISILSNYLLMFLPSKIKTFSEDLMNFLQN